jgi:hypothetical protein
MLVVFLFEATALPLLQQWASFERLTPFAISAL